MKENLIERIRQHLKDAEEYETECEADGYTDTEDLWSYLRQSMQLLSKVLIESEVKEEKRNED